MARRTILIATVLATLGVVAAPAGASAASCHTPGPRRPRIVATPPPQNLLSRMEVLRRPQTDSDRAYLDRFHIPFLTTISGPYLRVLGRTADEAEVVLAAGTQWYPIVPRRCLRRLSGHRRRVEERIQRRLRKRAREVRLTLTGFGGTYEQGGWGAGSIDARALANNHSLVTIGQSWGGSLVVGLAPDGVASIDLTFARDEARRVTVANNFWSTVVPWTAPRAFPLKTVWRAPDGSVVKTFRDEPGR
jgi:hypothetical protein